MNLFLRHIWLVLLTAFPLLLAGQQNYGEIRGTITDEDGEPFPFATVYIEHEYSRKTAVNSDFDGRYVLRPLEPGNYDVYVQAFGYQLRLITDVIVSPNKITFLDVKLAQETCWCWEGDWNRWYYVPLIRPKDVPITHIPAKEIQQRANNQHTVSLVTNSTSEVRQSMQTHLIHTRGSRGGSDGVYIDGVKVRHENGVPRLPSAGIQSIDTYVGSVPAKYGDLTGGLILIETKSYFDLPRKVPCDCNRDIIHY